MKNKLYISDQCLIKYKEDVKHPLFLSGVFFALRTIVSADKFNLIVELNDLEQKEYIETMLEGEDVLISDFATSPPSYSDSDIVVSSKKLNDFDGKTNIVISDESQVSKSNSVFVTNWKEALPFILTERRVAEVKRDTSETQISVKVDLDGDGKCQIKTGLGFFDHMLEQIARHGNIGLEITTQGDLHVDEHHTIEDTAIALGEALRKALGDKLGIERYGFALPMDDCSAQVLMDFGGRPWLVWETEFKREKVGDMPTEMFYHFFKSLADASLSNLNIKAEGTNEHHKIEGIFKAYARALKMAVRRDILNMKLPSTKGML